MLFMTEVAQYIGPMNALGDWLQRVARPIWAGGLSLPSRCAICHAWPARPICDECVARFAPPLSRCLTCALPVPSGMPRCGACLGQAPPLARCLCAVPYAWPWRDLITHFKFHAQPGWDRPLALLLRSSAWAEDLLLEADAVLPMPLSRERLAERGYNPAWLLARALAPRHADAGVLLRIRHTPAQHTLPRALRMTNLQGAFAVEPLRASEVRGRHLVLVDDVMTSGASLHCAAQTLLQAGAARISALVLARTEPHMDDRQVHGA